jgi:electron transfer flavoprotein alpha subunit
MGDGRVWIYLERTGREVSDTSLQAISCGLQLGMKGFGPVEGVCLGGSAAVLGHLPGGLDRIYHVQGGMLEDYTTDRFAPVLRRLIEEKRPGLVIFPSSTQGEDLASWLGANLGGAIVLGARRIRFADERLVASRVDYEGKVAVDFELVSSPAFLTLEEGAFQVPEGPAAETPITTIVPDTEPGRERVRVVQTEVAARTVNLREARTIVGVGAGIGNAERFRQIEELADLLHAEIGATRAAVDAGWVGHDRQIGQTGVKVKPDLYVACGISGTAQHRVGILESGTILSINIDPQAPIFRFSHYCVEGDLAEVLPKMIQLLCENR